MLPRCPEIKLTRPGSQTGPPGHHGCDEEAHMGTAVVAGDHGPFPLLALSASVVLGVFPRRRWYLQPGAVAQVTRLLQGVQTSQKPMI